MVGGQRLGFLASIKAPDFLRQSTLVAFYVIADLHLPGEVQRAAGITSLRGLMQRDRHRRAANGVDGVEAWVGLAGITLRGVKHFCIRRPALYQCNIAIEGQAHRRTATGGHHIDLSRPLVARGKRDPFSIGGNGRVRLCRQIGGEPLRRAARYAGAP